MIDVVYRVRVAPGKVEQALGWAKKHLEQVKRAGLLASGVSISILRPTTGETDEVVWVDRYQSMAAYEANFFGKAPADSGWAASMKAMADSDWFLGYTCRIYVVVEAVESTG
jgi:hypothetical protein